MLPLRGKIINVEKNRIDKVLSNNEIQAMITAIGTGIRDEFDIERARYHKVIVMCDADVDGAHIRTLVLTFLFREMPELIEAGYVYLGKAPLYKLKNGSTDLYIEKESELEEVLLRDKLEKIDVSGRGGSEFSLTHARWQKYNRLLKQFEGWAASAAVRVRLRHRHVPRGVAGPGLRVADPDAVIEVLRRPTRPRASPYETELLDQDETEMTVRVIERKTGSATTYILRKEMFSRARVRAASCGCTASSSSWPARLRSTSRWAARRSTALSFEELRKKVWTWPATA